MKRTLGLLAIAFAITACSEHVIVLLPVEEGSTGANLPSLDDATGSEEATSEIDDPNPTGTGTVDGTSSEAGSTSDPSSTGAGSSTDAGSSTGGPEPIAPLEPCHPLHDNVCTEGYACLNYAQFEGDEILWQWRCALFQGPEAMFGDPCTNNSYCEPIGLCLGAVAHGNCAGAESCCTEWCEVDNNVCPDGRDCHLITGFIPIPANMGYCAY